MGSCSSVPYDDASMGSSAAGPKGPHVKPAPGGAAKVEQRVFLTGGDVIEDFSLHPLLKKKLAEERLSVKGGKPAALAVAEDGPSANAGADGIIMLRGPADISGGGKAPGGSPQHQRKQDPSWAAAATAAQEGHEHTADAAWLGATGASSATLGLGSSQGRTQADTSTGSARRERQGGGFGGLGGVERDRGQQAGAEAVAGQGPRVRGPDEDDVPVLFDISAGPRTAGRPGAQQASMMPPGLAPGSCDSERDDCDRIPCYCGEADAEGLWGARRSGLHACGRRGHGGPLRPGGSGSGSDGELSEQGAGPATARRQAVSRHHSHMHIPGSSRAKESTRSGSHHAQLLYRSRTDVQPDMDPGHGPAGGDHAWASAADAAAAALPGRRVSRTDSSASGRQGRRSPAPVQRSSFIGSPLEHQLQEQHARQQEAAGGHRRTLDYQPVSIRQVRTSVIGATPGSPSPLGRPMLASPRVAPAPVAATASSSLHALHVTQSQVHLAVADDQMRRNSCCDTPFRLASAQEEGEGGSAARPLSRGRGRSHSCITPTVHGPVAAGSGSAAGHHQPQGNLPGYVQSSERLPADAEGADSGTQALRAPPVKTTAAAALAEWRVLQSQRRIGGDGTATAGAAHMGNDWPVQRLHAARSAPDAIPGVEPHHGSGRAARVLALIEQLPLEVEAGGVQHLQQQPQSAGA